MVCLKSSAEVLYVGGVWLFQARRRLHTVVEFRDEILYRSFDSNNCRITKPSNHYCRQWQAWCWEVHSKDK